MAYRLFKVYLRALLFSKARRDAWLPKLWVGAFDLPTFIPNSIGRCYRRKSWSILLPMWYDEPSVSRFMSTVRGELYVDVGASFGHYLRALSSNFRRMIAIEADPAIFKFLTESSPVNCKPINVAVAEKAGFAEFHVPAGQYNFGVGSLLPLEQRAAWVAPTNYRSFTVRTTTLDSILSAERDVDLIKVDVEGAEMLVLAGATHVMKNIARWLIEIHNPTERRAIVRLMTRHGYHSMKLDDRHYIFEQKIER